MAGGTMRIREWVTFGRGKTKNLVTQAKAKAAAISGAITGQTAAKDTEGFQREMEAVYEALVLRILGSERRIDSLEKLTRKLVAGCAVSILIAVAAILLALVR
jgi:hypothetical protein